MSAEKYVMSVIRNHALPNELSQSELNAIAPLKRMIAVWGGNNLCEIKLSGSRAKGTAIDLASDLDLFVSLSSATPQSLKEIYNSLYDMVSGKGIVARKQNVSIGVTYGGKKIDIVPAKRQGQCDGDHSLYKRKANSWTKTNIDTHIRRVVNSGRRNEIIALKVWRENHNLEFPSVLLETLAIEALSGQSTTTTSDNVWYMLQFIRENICSVRVLDPANTNNVISDDLLSQEKKLIAQQAEKSLAEKYWNQVIW